MKTTRRTFLAAGLGASALAAIPAALGAGPLAKPAIDTISSIDEMGKEHFHRGAGKKIEKIHLVKKLTIVLVGSGFDTDPNQKVALCHEKDSSGVEHRMVKVEVLGESTAKRLALKVTDLGKWEAGACPGEAEEVARRRREVQAESKTAERRSNSTLSITVANGMPTTAVILADET